MQFTDRFRERTAIGQDNLASGTVIGKLKQFNSNGQLVANSNILCGVALPSKTYEKCWDMVHKPPFTPDRGGPLYKVKSTLPGGSWADMTVSTKGFSVPGLAPGNYLVYQGKFGNPLFTGDTNTQLQYATAGFSSPYNTIFINSNVEAFGAEAFNRLRPKLEMGGLGQFVGELRDLPSMLKQTSKGFFDIWKRMGGSTTSTVMHPKKVAQHFLNHQFGWVPFISDINKAVEIQIFHQQFIDDLIAGNDVWIKKSRRLHENETRTRITLNTFSNGFEPNLGQLCKGETVSGSITFGWHELYKVMTDIVWASGEFKFYRPEFDRSHLMFDDNMNKIRQLMILHGLRINPSLVYKLTPWTWLIDWFSNTGRVVDSLNAVAEDGVVARNLYVMEHTTYTIEQISHCNFYTGPQAFHWSRIVDSKQRAHAGSAFGFIPPASLSGKQIAILGALGLDRSFH